MVEALGDQSAVIEKHYSNYEDPAGQMAFDANFMEVLETLSKGNSADAVAARRAAKAVLSQIEGGTPVSNEESNEAPSNPVMDKLLQRDAKRTIDEALPDGVRALFKKGLTDYILAEVAPEDLISMNEERVLGAAREYAKNNGLTSDDIYTAKGKPSTSKPATSTSRGQAETTSKSKESSETKDTPATPKTLSEYNKNRENFLRELVGA
jgi:hypothetical protein